MTLPLPPTSEQRRIVAELESRLSVIDTVGREVEDELSRADRLCQSILRRAFEGKLVQQDPDDEPASVLLERIRAERAAKAQPSKRDPKPRKTRVAAVEVVCQDVKSVVVNL